MYSENNHYIYVQFVQIESYQPQHPNQSFFVSVDCNVWAVFAYRCAPGVALGGPDNSIILLWCSWGWPQPSTWGNSKADHDNNIKARKPWAGTCISFSVLILRGYLRRNSCESGTERHNRKIPSWSHGPTIQIGRMDRRVGDPWFLQVAQLLVEAE